jgi:hypothetical protein
LRSKPALVSVTLRVMIDDEPMLLAPNPIVEPG